MLGNEWDDLKIFNCKKHRSKRVRTKKEIRRMKISALIERLKSEMAKKGDITVTVQRFNDHDNSYSFEPVEDTHTFTNENKQAETIVLCDKETASDLDEHADFDDEEILPMAD